MGHGATALTDLDTMFIGWDTAILTHGGVAGSAINGHFDAEYSEMNIMSGVSTTRPAFLCKASDVASAIKDDPFTVTSEIYAVTSGAYYVVSVQRNPDGGGPGTARVILRK